MKRVTAILALFAIVGMVFATGCSPDPAAAPEGGTAPAGDAKMAPAGDTKAPAGAPAPPGPK